MFCKLLFNKSIILQFWYQFHLPLRRNQAWWPWILFDLSFCNCLFSRLRFVGVRLSSDLIAPGCVCKAATFLRSRLFDDLLFVTCCTQFTIASQLPSTVDLFLPLYTFLLHNFDVQVSVRTLFVCFFCRQKVSQRLLVFSWVINCCISQAKHLIFRGC